MSNWFPDNGPSKETEVTIRTKPATQEYKDNWDRIFGKKSTDSVLPTNNEKAENAPGTTDPEAASSTKDV